MITPNKTILKCVYGSHLFGLDTPTSDKDYYVIFKEDIRNIVLQKGKDCWTENQNNTQHKELRKFLRDAMTGQTYAIELLFAPVHFQLESSDTWKEVVDNRDKLISQNLRPFLGYAHGQAQKYTGRTRNFEELKVALDVMKQYKQGQLLSEVEGLTFSEKIYEKIVTFGNGNTDKYIVFFHKEFPLNAKLSTVIPSVQKYVDEYGDRTKFYSSKQYDCKAFSHALRLCYMLEELMTTKNISFPVVNKDFLLAVKLGEVSYETVQSELEKSLQRIDTCVNQLPEKPDVKFWDGFILDKYLALETRL